VGIAPGQAAGRERRELLEARVRVVPERHEALLGLEGEALEARVAFHPLRCAGPGRSVPRHRLVVEPRGDLAPRAELRERTCFEALERSEVLALPSAEAIGAERVAGARIHAPAARHEPSRGRAMTPDAFHETSSLCEPRVDQRHSLRVRWPELFGLLDEALATRAIREEERDVARTALLDARLKDERQDHPSDGDGGGRPE
jgi:hypothetical protein